MESSKFTEIEENANLNFKFAGSNLGDLISDITKNYVLLIAGLMLLVYLVIGGFQYLTSAGDPKKTQIAQAKITQALLGFLIVFGSFWIVQILASVLGLEKVKNLFSR